MILSLLLLFNSLTLIGQSTNEIDSLQQLILTEVDDSLKAEYYNELSWILKERNKAEASLYGNKAFELSKAAHLKSVEATSLNRLGEIERLNRNWNEAKSYFKRALVIEKSIKNHYGIGRALGQLTSISNTNGHYDSALLYGNEAIKAFQKSRNYISEAGAHQRLAIAYLKKGDYNNALISTESVLQISEKHQLKTLSAGSYSSLGEIYTSLGLYGKAIGLFKKSIEIWVQKKDSSRLADDYLNLGYTYILADSLNKAMRLTNESLSLRIKIKSQLIHTNYNNLGLIAQKKDQLDNALSYYRKSLVLKVKDKHTTSMAISHYNIGLVLFKKGDYNDSLIELNKALKLAEDYGYPRLLKKLYWQLTQIHFKSGNNALVRRLIEKYKAVSTTIEEGKVNTLRGTDLFEESKIDSEISQYEARIEDEKIFSKNVIIYSLCALIILLFILFFYLIRNHQLKKDKVIAQKNAEINERKIKDLLQSQELSSFSTMIEVQEKERNRIARDLHDRLGGMLSMVKLHFKSVEDEINNLRQKNVSQYSKANDLLDEACEEVRKVAHDMTSGVLMNFGLVAALEDLKQTIEFTEKLKMNLVNVGLEQRLDFEYEINLYRIIQELVSNTLKHAQASEINIQVFKRNGQISLIYEDDGIGFSADNEKSNTGMGLKNVTARVFKFNGQMNIDSGIGGGTTITIDIPLKK